LVRQAGVGVGVFRLQVIEHLGAVAVFQPLVGIGARDAAGDGGLAHGWPRKRERVHRVGGPLQKPLSYAPLSPPETPMIDNDYLLAWALYLSAGLGLMLVWMRLTRW